MKKINKKRVAFASLVIICLIIIIALIINLTILPLLQKISKLKQKKKAMILYLWLLLVIILFMSVFFNMPALTVHMTLPLAINI